MECEEAFRATQRSKLWVPRTVCTAAFGEGTVSFDAELAETLENALLDPLLMHGLPLLALSSEV